jgi:diguanylate cyclase (GGDEF)-like protein
MPDPDNSVAPLMNLHILQLPKLITERRSSAILGVVIIAMLWAVVALKYSEDVQADTKEAERTNRNFAMVFEENVLRSIGEIDKALLYLRRTVETRKASTNYHAIVQSADVLSDIILQAAIVDDKGIIRWSNAQTESSPAISVADREHIKAQLNSTEDNLFISKPLIGRASRQWSVQFTRRFMNDDGTIGGVVVASLNPAHFTSFYDRIDLGPSASISLIGSDGVVRASGGATGGSALGQDFNGTSLLAHIGAGSNATFDDDTVKGEARLVTIRKVKGHPLWVSVSVKKSEIYKDSWTTLQLNVAAAIVLTLIILAAMERILRTEGKARHKADQLQLTLENMSQGIMLVTKDFQIPVINGQCAELLGLPPDLIKRPPRFDQFGEFQDRIGELPDRPAPAEDFDANAASGQFTISERSMPNGSIIEIRNGRLPDGGFVQTFTDITERCAAEARIAKLASEDPLTGLPNRRVFRSALDKVNQRQGPAADDDARPPIEFAVLFLDLDRFKVVNDTLGHRVGDLLLQEVAKRLKWSLRETDVLARLGGDEFAVVVTPVESRAAIVAMAHCLIEAISQPYEIDTHRIRTSVSIGIAVGPLDGDNADDLLMDADLALYAVKAGGRGTYRFYEKSMNEGLQDRRQIEMDLREALERNELELHYQPIIDLRSNVVTGFEALARWRHPTRGMVPPALFIPVAEDSGLILPLGEWALTEACRQAAQWPEHLKIAVNLSPVQFSIPSLYNVVKSTLAATGLAPQRLELEITERLFMEDSEKTLTTLHRLKELGVRISMDDFGTGYSSLSYLRSFPYDKIKVDRAFISDLAEGTEHVVIVQAVVSIARALGMATTAEGVETAGQREFLTALGCDEAQGYLFSPPVPIEKVPEIIAEWAAKRTLAA